MPLRVTGMNSGLDTDTIIKELVNIERTKVDALKKQQTRLQWKQDAWKGLNSKIKNLFNKTISGLTYQTSYMKKATTVSNPNAVSVITGQDAVNGVLDLKILNQGKTGYLTGKKLSDTGAYTASSKLSDIAPGSFGNGESGVFNITAGGRTTEIQVDGDTTISDVLTKLKGAGVNASFDERNQRLYISAKESGQASDFTLTASDANGANAMAALGINTSLDNDQATLAEYRQYAAYYVAGDRTATLANMQGLIDAEIASRVAGYKRSNESIVSSMNSINTNIAEIMAKDDYVPGDTEQDIQDRIDILNEELEDASLTEEEKAAKREELGTLGSRLIDVKQIGTYNQELTRLQTQKTANDEYIDTDANGNATAKNRLTQEVGNAYYNKAEYAASVMASYVPGASTDGANRVEGKDAAIILNGAEYTSTNNVFEVNGLTFTILTETAENITVTTQEDTDGIYDMVKNFLKEYNSLIIEMDKLYNADTAKGYEPLTTEEKADLSDGEVEKWEEKIKDSILRRDNSLGSVSTMMSSIMSAGVEIDGRKVNLSEFGISTLSYFDAADNEKRAYHIDGDPDDSNTGGKTDKLKGAIANDSAFVAEFFTGLAKNLNDSWRKLSASNELSSYNTAYNDKQMLVQYNDYTTKIKKQEDRLAAMENRWYAKFSAMETALSKLQSNQNAVSSLLGGL